MINPSLLKVRTGNDESKIAVPVLEVRLGAQGNLPAISTGNLEGEIHHSPTNMQTPTGNINGHSSNDEVVLVIKNAQRTDRATADRRPHEDGSGFEFAPV